MKYFIIFFVIAVIGCQSNSRLEFKEIYIGLNNSPKDSLWRKITLLDTQQIIVSENGDTQTYKFPYSEKTILKLNQFSRFIKSRNDSDYTFREIIDSVDVTTLGSASSPKKVDLIYKTRFDKKDQTKIWFATNVNDTTFYFYYGAYSDSMTIGNSTEIINILKQMKIIDKEIQI